MGVQVVAMHKEQELTKKGSCELEAVSQKRSTTLREILV